MVQGDAPRSGNEIPMRRAVVNCSGEWYIVGVYEIS
jgi:hypothetical protein